MPLTHDEIESKVVQIIADQLDADATSFDATDLLVDNLGADSLDLVELFIALETEFGMTVPEEDAENIHTVGEVVAYIQKRTT